jgi:hypothetical protein
VSFSSALLSAPVPGGVRILACIAQGSYPTSGALDRFAEPTVDDVARS